jgi:hypothetical protein
MKRCTPWILIFVFSALTGQAQVDSLANPADTSRQITDSIAQRLVLIGDAGQLTDGWHPVVNAVKNNITLDKKTTVLYLGDNLYKVGLPDEEFAEYAAARAVLDTQLSIADGTDARVFMIPGNHDWHNGGRTGYDAIIRQQLYVDFLSVEKPNVRYYPSDGCPGPNEIKLGDLASIIVFDSQWWVHPHDKPGIESDCDCKTQEELVQQIEDMASRSSDKLVILACHHPFKSTGPHGGFFTLKQHIFPLTDWRPNLYIPLPIIGSIYPISRSVFGTPQDVNHPVYQTMVNQVTEGVRRAAPNALFVAGHEHNLQHIQDSSYHYIVSGGGCKENRASDSRKSEFVSPTQGFGVIEITHDKNVYLTFYTVSDSVRKAYSAFLLNFNKPSEAAIDSTESRPNVDPFLRFTNNRYSISASDKFPPVTGLRKFFMGQNYRYEWSEPVDMPVFNINKEMGGFEILSLGGGKQTTSLRLRNRVDNREYVLRSLNKNTTQAIPEQFRFSLAKDLVAELTSASHPYAALIVPPLAEKLDLTVAQPKLFFVPEDQNFGFYTDLFKNTVCMLERRHAAWPWDSIDTRSTAKVFDKMLDDNDHQTIQEEVVKARLLDMLLADFDRHFDQWRWGNIDTGKGRQYYPIARDRDQALFYSDGFLLRVVSSRIMPFLKGFHDDIPRSNWLGYAARDFDRIFMPEMDQGAWERAINKLQTNLTDSVIRQAVMKLPPEIFKISGEEVIRKLISRRDLIDEAGLEYYRFISRQVNVIGSNEKEYFKVSNHGAGLQVRVYAYPKGKDTSFIMFDRIFDPSVTKEIRLFGLNDDDKFEIEENAKSRIKIRIIGGKGYDTFDIRGNVENLLYDLNTDLNYIANESRSKNRFSLDPPNNERSILGYEYNYSKFPQFSLGFNSDDRLFGGAAFSRRTYGFRNLPYATDQRLSLAWAFRRRAYHLKYKGEFNHITRQIDLVVNAQYYHPALRNFFGIGNKTVIDDSKPFHYYQTRYRSFEAELLLRKRFFDKFHIQFGPYFFHYQADIDKNRNTILADYRESNLDSSRIFGKKQYLGGKLSFLLNNLNNELFPTRGMHWTNDFYALRGMKGASNYLAYVSDMKVYASLTDPAKLVSVLKLGWGRIYSKNYEYFQAMNFGVTQSLYSFRKNRYSGRGMMYGSLEMRLKLADINSYILPGALGILGFYDVGRIFEKTLPGKKWHTGYGGGFYFIPFNLFLITATAGISEGEPVYYFSVGTRVNISF